MPAIDQHGYVARQVTHICGHTATIYHIPSRIDEQAEYEQGEPCPECRPADHPCRPL